MNLLRCDNGHFYDGDSFSECPHCISGAAKGSQGKGPRPESQTVALNKIKVDRPSKEKKEKKEPTSIFGSFFKNKDKENRTVTPVSEDMGTSQQKVEPLSTGESDVGQASEKSQAGYGSESPLQEADASQKEEAAESLQQSLKAAGVDQDDIKTISYFGSANGIEPVVGWLVAIKGEDKGSSYTLKAEKNFIGRSAAMDVVIVSDKKVSREKHTCVMYDPMSKKTYLLSNDSNGMVYTDGAALMENRELHDRDCFQIGNTTLMFVPFCNESFYWDEED